MENRRRAKSCEGLLPVVHEEDKNMEEEKKQVVPNDLKDQLLMNNYCKRYCGLKLVCESMNDESEKDSWSQVS